MAAFLFATENIVFVSAIVLMLFIGAVVGAEEQVQTSRQTEVAERTKRIELIDAAREAERAAIQVRVEAEAEKQAAVDRAEALRLAADGEAEAAKLRAAADRVRFEVEAAGQRAVNEAANILSSDQMSLQTKIALFKVLPELVREAAKPTEAIDSIKIVQVDGLIGAHGDGTTVIAGGEQNLANAAVSAALRYRAQAPVIDGLMKDLGLDGFSLDALVKGAVEPPARPVPAHDPAVPVKRKKAPRVGTGAPLPL